MRPRSPLLLLVPWLLASPALADQDLAPVASYTVTTRTRTLRGCPLKRVITTLEGWRHVVDRLEGAPPAPDFKRHVALLIVADVTDGGSAHVRALSLRPDGAVRVLLERDEPGSLELRPAPELRCFFLVLPPFKGGVHLDHRTVLDGEAGSKVTLAHPPDSRDRDQARLPTLGPDLRLTYSMKDGSVPPDTGILLRQESFFARQDLTGRVQTDPFPPHGIVAAFPRFRDDVRFVLAAHGPNVRSVTPLELKALPPPGPDGSPAPITFEFELEPVVPGAR